MMVNDKDEHTLLCVLLLSCLIKYQIPAEYLPISRTPSLPAVDFFLRISQEGTTRKEEKKELFLPLCEFCVVCINMYMDYGCIALLYQFINNAGIKRK